MFVTQLGAALSFSDQIIFPSIDRKHEEGEGIFSSHIPFQVVKSLSQRREGCAHPRASGTRARYKNMARFSPTSG